MSLKRSLLIGVIAGTLFSIFPIVWAIGDSADLLTVFDIFLGSIFLGIFFITGSLILYRYYR